MKRIGRFELISFITGFSLLTYELAAARVLAPSIGSSTYVWTGVIGVIIAALSAGFLTGGKLADSRNKASDVVWLLLLAALFSVVTLTSYLGLLDWVVTAVTDSRLQAVVSALLLFAPTSFFIGMTSPYLAKLNVTSLKSTGQAIASLDTFNAVGGILGTFTTGFILFGFIGSREAIIVVVLLLIASSWLLMPRLLIAKRLVASGVLLFVAFIPQAQSVGAIDIDTASAHYKVIQGYFNLRPATGLITGPGGTQSAVYDDDSGELVFWYANQMAALTVERQPASVLMLGGGAFTLPQYLSEQLPNAQIDVVEIDPELLEVSKDYFYYDNPQNVTEIFTDARTYVNQTNKQYDVILVDVYGDASIPFSLMTREYGQAVAELLKPNGVLIANVIAGSNGGACQDVLSAIDSAYRSALPYAVYRNEYNRPEIRANYVLVYSRQPVAVDGFSSLPAPNAAAYSDNYAPAERLYYNCQQQAYQG